MNDDSGVNVDEKVETNVDAIRHIMNEILLEEQNKFIREHQGEIVRRALARLEAMNAKVRKANGA